MPKKLAYLIATCGYAGYFPFAPGTVGSAVGVALYLLLEILGSSWALGLTLVSFTLAGIWAAGVVEHNQGKEDPSIVVVDELAGMLLSFVLLPLSWMGIVAGFFVFRLLDIIKPFPCRRAERLGGGLGIMADDLLAGLYTNLILRIVAVFIPALLD
jgi:phosphatidylglycerophosphatase A